MSQKVAESKSVATSFRLSETGHQLLRATADRLGLSLGSTIEVAVRKLAYLEGIEVSSLKKEGDVKEVKE